tara:strand:- start:53035 stop:53433 length:399 start_codon:yes stop_codon:yes gene_type:complete
VVAWTLADGPLAPGWLVLPLAAVALIATAAHIIVLREAPKGAIPESRRRVRVATGWVILVTIPLTAYGFGIADPGRPGVFMTVWLAVIGLIGSILLLAMLDAANTLRLHRAESRRLRQDLRYIRENRHDADA